MPVGGGSIMCGLAECSGPTGATEIFEALNDDTEIRILFEPRAIRLIFWPLFLSFLVINMCPSEKTGEELKAEEK